MYFCDTIKALRARQRHKFHKIPIIIFFSAQKWKDFNLLYRAELVAEAGFAALRLETICPRDASACRQTRDCGVKHTRTGPEQKV